MPNLQTVFDSESPVAIVTGSGAKRVGRAVIQELAKSGCRVVIHANTSVDEANQLASQLNDSFQTESLVVTGSLTRDDVPGEIVKQTMHRFGRIDILVNSAAIWYPTDLKEVTPGQIREYLQINTVGSFLCAQHAGLQMVDQNTGGCIVNIGDWATVRPYVDHSAYFPSKGAVEAMTRSLAVEFGHRNPKIRVNCIQPGPVALASDVSDEYEAKISTSTIVGKVGTPEHVAHAVKFLCENDFVTGVCLPIDGGRSIFAPDGIQVGLNSG